MLTVGKAETATKNNLKVGKLTIYTFMKKISILIASVSLISCQNNVPKCDDADVLKTIYAIINENKDKIENSYGQHPLGLYPEEKINAENIEITEIITSNKDSELKSCGCEAKISIANLQHNGLDSNGELAIELDQKARNEGTIQYTAQNNSEDNIIVKVENITPLELKMK